MMRYSFHPPDGWSRYPFPLPQRGVYLRSPDLPPSPMSASILLFDAIAATGPLEAQLAELVQSTCAGLTVGTRSRVEPVTTRSYSALGMKVKLPDTGPHGELRIYVLIETGAERLPVTFIGGPKSLPRHQAAFDGLLASIGELVVEPGLYTRWLE